MTSLYSIQQHRHNTSNSLTLTSDHYSSTDMQGTNHPYHIKQIPIYTTPYTLRQAVHNALQTNTYPIRYRRRLSPLIHCKFVHIQPCSHCNPKSHFQITTDPQLNMFIPTPNHTQTIWHQHHVIQRIPYNREPRVVSTLPMVQI